MALLVGVGAVGALLFSDRLPDSANHPAIMPDRDCADFATEAEAQKFFRSQGPGDPHRLDEDRDERACEALR